ncbi:MAG TPA: hypothetical protein VMH35_20990 [Streptosporangiaceae bacterium]|nr:hypothetical protein [Streptosporangiaceae bacterium]
MPNVAVLGGEVVGLSTGMLLAGPGCQITVLERDPAGLPESPGGAWQDWSLGRPGLADRIASAAAGQEDFVLPGPTRAELLGSLP